MKYVLESGTLTFAKGAKPFSIKQAQREVRDAYMVLCHTKPGVARNYEVAYATLLHEDPYAERLLKYSSTYKHAMSSASRAYTAMGQQLAQKTMYSMNIIIPVAQLAECKDIPSEMIELCKASGLLEICFSARELQP